MIKTSKQDKLRGCLSYCKSVNGRPDCKNCGLTKKIIEEALTERDTIARSEVLNILQMEFESELIPYEMGRSFCVLCRKSDEEKYNVGIRKGLEFIHAIHPKEKLDDKK